MSTSSHTHALLDLVGQTPLVLLKNIETMGSEIFLKLEQQNPGGSIKDRIALSMINAAEREGKLNSGGTIIEATAGNTGSALALIAVQRGYKCILIVPDKMSQEKVLHLRALGVDVRMTRSDVQKGHPEYYQDKASAIAEKTANAFYVNQFENPNNPAAHERTTGPEIWEQMRHRVDAVVCGVGTGGTITGLGRFFKQISPSTEIILADPEGSILTPYLKTGKITKAGQWVVEGIGEDYIPKICDLSFVKEAYTITDQESITAAHMLLQKEGIFGGSSSGTLFAAALKYAQAQTRPKRIVTFICDSGSKYLSKIYNDDWLKAHGFKGGTL